MADMSGWVGASPYAAQLPQFRELLREKAEAVAEAFRSRCGEAGVEVEMVLRTGHPIPVLIEEARKAELLILGQKGEHAEFVGEMMGSTVERVCRHTERPCLVTPAEFRPISRILVAYDGSGHAGKALQVAAELSVSISASIVMLSIDEKGDAKHARDIAEAGARLAQDHGAHVETLIVEGKAGPTLLQTAEEQGCNLIAMGAFGHSRIREFLIGSAATHVAARSHGPVLMAR
jgi:nucleotide-binding universal stress UspA family protein